jgi:flagellar hook-basal body complex protein FliE
MSGLKIGQIDPGRQILKPVPEVGKPPKEGGVSFGNVIKGVVDDAIKAEQDAHVAIADFASGNLNDVHDVMMAVGKANMAVSLLVQIRNGVLQAYNELSKISM